MTNRNCWILNVPDRLSSIS
ncbi:Protein grainyhead, partial [Araneus ventricosus]